MTLKDLQIDQSIEDLERITAKLKHQLKEMTELEVVALSVELLKEKIKKE